MQTSLDDEIIGIVQKMVDDISNEKVEITPGKLLRDLGIDSLHAIDLVFRLEEHFDIVIPMDNFPYTNVGDAITYLKTLLSSNSRPAAD